MTTMEPVADRSQLALSSLDIKNFRTFRHLNIPQLGRINLITGKNNVGKSSLLEAILLYARSGVPSVLHELLDNRDELRISGDINERNALSQHRLMRELDTDLYAIKHLFHGHINIDQVPVSMNIGLDGALEKSLIIDLQWYARTKNAGGNQDDRQGPQLQLITVDHAPDFENTELYISATVAGKLIYRVPLEMTITRSLSGWSTTGAVTNSQYIRCNGLSNSQISRLWDNIAATGLEDDVLSALRLIEPNLERIVIVGDPERSGRKRVPLAKIAGSERIPLRSYGDGMNRLFGITLGLVNSQDGIFLIDEIENGLHYSVLPEVWKFLYRVARQWNVQIFATTHSWDCIEAFQQVTEEDNCTDGMLVRLQRKEDDVTATVFDKRRLAIATREQIEVR